MAGMDSVSTLVCVVCWENGSPASSAVASRIIAPLLALTPGTRLGVYEVAAQIGEGGMGQVYRARDTTLHRDVALKVLPDAFAGDPEPSRPTVHA